MTAAERLGFALPLGSHMISEGDDAIRHNAERAAELIEQLESSKAARIHQHTPDDIVGGDPAGAATELVTSRLGMGVGDLSIGIASDSTANDGNDWAPLLLRLIAARYPGVRIVRNTWDHAVNGYGTPFVLQEGEGTESTGGTILLDRFNRTGDLTGSSPDIGPAWSGGAGSISTGNGVATLTGTAGIPSVNIGSTDVTLRTVWDVVTTGTGTTQTWRIYLGNLTNGLWISPTVNAQGAASVALWKTIGGSSTTLRTVNLADIGVPPSSSSASKVTIAVEVAIQNVSLTVTHGSNTVTETFTITEAEYAALGSSVLLYAPSTGGTGLRLDEIEASTPLVPGTLQTLTMWNAARGGANLQYQQDRLPHIFPEPLDLLIIAHGHNNGSQSGAAFTASLGTFVTAFREYHPDAALVLSSQNPQFAPAAQPHAHALRQQAGRAYAIAQAWTYVPVFERFHAQPDQGRSWVIEDGVHPTTPGADVGYEPTPGTGATEWAQEVLTTLLTTPTIEETTP